MAFIPVLLPPSMRSSRRRPSSDAAPASARPAAGASRRGDGKRHSTNNAAGLAPGTGTVSPRKRREQRELSSARDEAEALLATGAAGNASLAEVARIKRERDALRGKARSVADRVLGDGGGMDGGVEVFDGDDDEALRREFERKEAEIVAAADLRRERREGDEDEGVEGARAREGDGGKTSSSSTPVWDGSSSNEEKSATARSDPGAMPSSSASSSASPSSAPAAAAAAEDAPSGAAGVTPCAKCEGKGYLWECEACDAEGFLKVVTPATSPAAVERFGASPADGAGGADGEVLWRTCEKCIGVGRMPCDVCQGPVFSETITPVK